MDFNFRFYELAASAYIGAMPTHPPPLLIGCAAGFSGDRTDAAGPVVDTLIARLSTGPAGQQAVAVPVGHQHLRAVGRGVDAHRAAAGGERVHHALAAHVDHRDRLAVGVGDVDLAAAAGRHHPGRRAAHRHGGHHLVEREIDHRDVVAALVGDVGERRRARSAGERCEAGQQQRTKAHLGLSRNACAATKRSSCESTTVARSSPALPPASCGWNQKRKFGFSLIEKSTSALNTGLPA